MTSIGIGNRPIGPGHPCYIIAEAGSNHDGKREQAFSLIDVAVEAQADAVKFQLFTADKLAARTREEIASLRDQFGEFGDNLYELYKKMETPVEWMQDLQDYANERGIHFLVTPFDEGAADQLQKIGVKAYKIASFEMVHLPLLQHVASLGKPVVLSTGMGDLADIEDALTALRRGGCDDVVLLHCGIGYPMPFSEVHLAAMDTMRQAFQLPVGYSDHTSGITVPIAAVARGANVIEKHFTVDKGLSGPDHFFAIGPAELRNMVAGIRDTEAAIGSPRKRLSPSEEEYNQRGRRSLFAATDIEQGTEIQRDMLVVLRPGIGLAPKMIDLIVGRKARRTIRAHEPITSESV